MRTKRKLSSCSRTGCKVQAGQIIPNFKTPFTLNHNHIRLIFPSANICLLLIVEPLFILDQHICQGLYLTLTHRLEPGPEAVVHFKACNGHGEITPSPWEMWENDRMNIPEGSFLTATAAHHPNSTSSRPCSFIVDWKGNCVWIRKAVAVVVGCQ